eukprot:COSAG06_NODE_50034_length_321_cov_0.846847_2_plen_22_part_01
MSMCPIRPISALKTAEENQMHI